MSDNIISDIEMCRREGSSLQQGMNFGLRGHDSVILMSIRPNAPYRDRVEDGGTPLISEGHDQPRSPTSPNPKAVDQPECYPSGTLPQNGKFHEAAQLFKAGQRAPEQVRVYEEIRPGIWADNGVFHLVDSWREHDGARHVCKFRLHAVAGDEQSTVAPARSAERRRIIPTPVK
jgi:hypothetical protein